MAQENGTAAQLRLQKVGGPFELVRIPIPSPAEDEVVINVKAIGLNPVDWKQMDYGIMIQKWPAVLGIEGSGIITAVGAGVGEKFKIGDEVMTHLWGIYQEYVSVKAYQIGFKPKNMSFEDAASLPVGFHTAAGTAHAGLKIPLPFLPGSNPEGNKPKSVLILGGSSAVGSAAIQLLRLALPDSTLLTTCSSKHHGRALELGANAAFDPRSSNVVSEIRTAAGGKGVEAILDAVNGVATQFELLDVLTGPKLFAEVPTSQNVNPEKLPKDVQFSFAGSMALLPLPGGNNGMAALASLLEEGNYIVPIHVDVAGNGLENLEGALAKLRKGVSGTKIVVSV